jgi:hypothetical protein
VQARLVILGNDFTELKLDRHFAFIDRKRRQAGDDQNQADNDQD